MVILGSEIWRLIQTIENVKASIDSLINGPGYTSYFNQYLQKTQRVSFYRLETIHSKLTKLNDEFETNKLKLLDELKKVGLNCFDAFNLKIKIYDDETISQWSAQNFHTSLSQISSAISDINLQLKSMKK